MRLSHALAKGAVALLLLFAAPVLAEDMVTIPKSRLQELERKEAELQRLQGLSAPAAAPAAAPSAANTITPHTAAAPAAKEEPAKTVPAVAELPPLTPGEVVEAAEVAAHYLANPVVADRRYLKARLAVRGEILRFGKRMFSSEYTLILKTAGPAAIVACELSNPDTYNSVFPAKQGSELIAEKNRRQVTLAKVGQTVVVEGRCKGYKDGAVVIAGQKFRIESGTKQ